MPSRKPSGLAERLSPRERPGAFFAALVALAVLLALAERGVAALRARVEEPWRGAAWIWADGVHESATPVAFFAVRDVELDTPRPAWLAVAGDEVWTAWVNGRRAGTGVYQPGEPAALLEVGDLLVPGWNRLVLEAGSSRGAGGLLASLRVGAAGRAVLGTDGAWRIYRRHHPGVLRGWSLEGGEAPRIWPGPPAGRWAVAAPALRPSLAVGAGPARSALRVRLPWASRAWHELQPTERLPRIGPRGLFDWGEAVTGCLVLELASSEPGLLYVGDSPPDGRSPPADAIILPIPGRRQWIDARVRTFRYAWIVGTELAAAPVVDPVPPPIAAAYRAPPPLTLGTFGLAPPRPDTLAEERIRRRIEEKLEQLDEGPPPPGVADF